MVRLFEKEIAKESEENKKQEKKQETKQETQQDSKQAVKKKEELILIPRAVGIEDMFNLIMDEIAGIKSEIAEIKEIISQAEKAS
jgi:hypothetical protein